MSPPTSREGETSEDETDSWVSRKGDNFGVLEPYAGKLSRTVLRGREPRGSPPTR